MIKSRFRHKPPYKRNHDYAKYFADSGFNVRSLFSQGEPGAWYDPSDLTSMYQDSNGETPAAINQPVGLILDKRLGLVLGPEQRANGILQMSGATTPATYNTVTGEGTSFRLDATNLSGVDLPVPSAGTYLITIQNTGANNVAVRILGAGIAKVVSAGVTTTLRLAVTTGFRINGTVDGSAQAFTIHAVKLVPGNHATQSTSASRPTLSARYNLLTKSDQFDDVVWSKTDVTVTSNATTAPDGTLTADLLTEGAAGTALTQCPLTVVAGVRYKAIFYCKANAVVSWLRLIVYDFADAANQVRVWFNAIDGSKGISAATGVGLTFHDARVVPAAQGFYRVEIEYTSAVTSLRFGFKSANGDGSTAPVADSSYFTWGADVRTQADAALNIPAYQRVNTATDYDTVGFPMYLLFDGFDDSLVTSTIDLSASAKATIWAGVTKFSDAATGALIEGPASRIAIFAPSSAIPTYSFRTYGSTSAATGISPQDYPAPNSSVLTLIADNSEVLAENQVKAHINGVAIILTGLVATGPGMQPSSAFNLGIRGGGTLPFNGRLYPLIMRGGASLTGEISAAERYTGSKMGIVL